MLAQRGPRKITSIVQTAFYLRKCYTFNSNFIKVCSPGSNWLWVNMGLSKGLVCWGIYGTLDFNMLIYFIPNIHSKISDAWRVQRRSQSHSMWSNWVLNTNSLTLFTNKRTWRLRIVFDYMLRWKYMHVLWLLYYDKASCLPLYFYGIHPLRAP